MRVWKVALCVAIVVVLAVLGFIVYRTYFKKPRIVYLTVHGVRGCLVNGSAFTGVRVYNCTVGRRIVLDFKPENKYYRLIGVLVNNTLVEVGHIEFTIRGNTSVKPVVKPVTLQVKLIPVEGCMLYANGSLIKGETVISKALGRPFKVNVRAKAERWFKVLGFRVGNKTVKGSSITIIVAGNLTVKPVVRRVYVVRVLAQILNYSGVALNARVRVVFDNGSVFEGITPLCFNVIEGDSFTIMPHNSTDYVSFSRSYGNYSIQYSIWVSASPITRRLRFNANGNITVTLNYTVRCVRGFNITFLDKVVRNYYTWQYVEYTLEVKPIGNLTGHLTVEALDKHSRVKWEGREGRTLTLNLTGSEILKWTIKFENETGFRRLGLKFMFAEEPKLNSSIVIKANVSLDVRFKELLLNHWPHMLKIVEKYHGRWRRVNWTICGYKVVRVIEFARCRVEYLGNNTIVVYPGNYKGVGYISLYLELNKILYKGGVIAEFKMPPILIAHSTIYYPFIVMYLDLGWLNGKSYYYATGILGRQFNGTTEGYYTLLLKFDWYDAFQVLKGEVIPRTKATPSPRIAVPCPYARYIKIDIKYVDPSKPVIIKFIAIWG